MKKLVLILALALLIPASAHAYFGAQEDGTTEGIYNDLNVGSGLDGSGSGGVYTVTVGGAVSAGDATFTTVQGIVGGVSAADATFTSAAATTFVSVGTGSRGATTACGSSTTLNFEGGILISCS